jgi:large subunit ribosomal protein L10
VDKSKKQESIKQIEEILSRCTIAIATDYRGLKVADMSDLRRKLRASSTEYHVVKNTMARFAAEKVGKESLKELLQGPTALALGYGEVTEPAKALAEYIQASKLPLTIKGAILGDRLLKPEEVTQLATLPPKEVLMSKLLGILNSPITGLIVTLNANLRSLVNVLDARRRQLEGA